MTETAKFTIAIADGAVGGIDSFRTTFSSSAEIVVGPIATAQEVAALTENADALIVSLQPLRAEHIAALSSSVKIIGRAGVGLDTIDLAAAKDRGIRVVYQPNYATNEVADQAASMALAAWRRLGNANALVRSANGWGTSVEVGQVHALQESTLGVLGTGRIGRALISRMRPFVSRVVVFDAYPADIEGVEWADSVEELLQQANLLSLHLPLTDETRHVIDAAAIERMPDGAVLVNVSRGGLVDERAVAEALVSGKLAAAGLDVFEHEPLEADSPLRTAPNLLLSPHVAWYSVESGIRLASWSLTDVVSFLADNELKNGSWAW